MLLSERGDDLTSMYKSAVFLNATKDQLFGIKWFLRKQVDNRAVDA